MAVVTIQAVSPEEAIKAMLAAVEDLDDRSVQAVLDEIADDLEGDAIDNGASARARLENLIESAAGDPEALVDFWPSVLPTCQPVSFDQEAGMIRFSEVIPDGVARLRASPASRLPSDV